MNPGVIISTCKRAGLSGPTVSADVIRSLEVGLNGRFPMQYRLLLEKIGAIELRRIAFSKPQHILGYAASIWNMSEATSNFWAAVPVARHGGFGDDIGFLRRDASFSDEVFLLDHEKPWYADQDTGWNRPLAADLATLVDVELSKTASKCRSY